MPQLVKKRRSGWAVLAAGALVASLLAVGSAPAGAAEIKIGEDNKAEQNAKPTFSACVGKALDDHGFTDLGSLSATVPNINCLAYYGITVGMTADTFDPNSNVTRRHMALFLYRAAGLTGIDLMGGDMMADFGDIDMLGEDMQNAITALARNGILPGRSSMAYEPYADITRAEMAVALVNLVRHTAPGNFVQAGTDKGKLAVNGAAISADALDYFADARRIVPVAVDTAISYAYELGITSGYPDAMFGPNDGVPRRDMATFIMNALAHSNLRPAGLTVQSDNGALTASLRNADFEPDANELIDAFYVDATREARAFNNDGECRSIVKAVDGSTTSTCEISILDSATDDNGNAPLNGLTATQIGKGVSVWVWTGKAKDEVDDDTDLVEFSQGPVVAPSASSKITVSPSQAKTPMARFGTAVQFTGQLQYVEGGLDKDTSAGADVEMGGAEYSLVKHVYTGTIAGGTFAVDVGTGAVTAQDSGGTALGLVSRSAPETLNSDPDGKVTFSLSTDDPNPTATSLMDTRTVVYVLTPAKNAPGAGDPPTARASGYVVFAEAASKVTSVSVESIGSYAELGSASNPTSHGVTVTVRDQYGRPMRNQPVVLTTSVTGDPNPTVLPGSRRTGPSGSVRIFYSHSGTTQITETITAWTESSTTSSTAAAPAISAAARPDSCVPGTEFTYETSAGTPLVYTVTTGQCGMASVFWAQRTTAASEGTAQAIIAASLADDEVVVNATTPVLLRYDDNDIFHTTVPDGAGGTTASYTDMEGFETLLATVVDPDNLSLATTDTGRRNGTLVWDGYDHDDEDARTLFTFVLTVVS